jgi:eukaryotic-like serine/threonine-protein kinase
MAFSAGDKLGPYEILAPIGAGGMGEVYRAKDTKLGRDVALKILPVEMSRIVASRCRTNSIRSRPWEKCSVTK